MNKYRAKKTNCNNGHCHDSKRESKRCDDLHLFQRAGHIAGLCIEPQYYFHINGNPLKHPNGRRAGYKPDFSYSENGKVVCEDVKSSATMTEAAVLRMTLFRHLFPHIELRVMK